MSTNSNPTNNSGGSNVVNWIDSIDLSKYPQLAQRVAAMNQVGLTLVENYVLAETMEAQGSFMVGGVDAGFSSANSTFLYGTAEGLMGIGQAASAGMTVGSSIQNLKEISGLQKETGAALQELKSTKNATDNIIPENAEDTELSTLHGNGSSINANEEDNKVNNEKKPDPARTEKQILSEHETKLEALKSKNTAATSKAQIVQSLSQTGQLLAQGAQSNSQIAQMEQQVMNNNFSAAQAAGQTANQTLNQVLQFDPYAQNVASSRA